MRAVSLSLGLLAALAAAPAAGEDGAFPVVSRPFTFSETHAPGERYMGLRLLGSVELVARRVDGLPLVELSGLAWDDDDEVLYALSDDGSLFQLKPRLEQGILTEVRAVAAYRLTGPDGRPFQGADRDSEGLDVVRGRDGTAGNAELGVSFERRPRLLAFTPRGRQTGTLAIAPVHQDITRYRSANKALEAAGFHPRLGWLTAPEWPLAGEREIGIRDAQGRAWRYPRYPASKCALVAFEVLPDESLLTLDRCFEGATFTLVVALRRTERLVARSDGPLHPRAVAIFDSRRGDFAVDNFEGLTRHRGNRFFMVSDDNQSFLQRTLLVYFELLGTEGENEIRLSPDPDPPDDW